ncbi:hypothetical protein [Aestuariimicrobium sp. Y1814]|uniref:hypothetical protein n=1 Tax=Aestuariimicrobium sp. Y1814 TaxID=3418742 RepID=UPI003DA732EE
MSVSRRHALVHGSRLLVAGGALAVLSGCTGIFGERASSCDVIGQVDLANLGVRLGHVPQCNDATPRQVTHDVAGPVWSLGEFTAYLLPDDHQADPELPINGDHGLYRSADQLPSGELLDWDDGSAIVYARQMYTEYTNSRNDYADHYAFVSFGRPPVAGRSVLTLRWRHVAWGKPAPESDLRAVATSAELL